MPDQGNSQQIPSDFSNLIRSLYNSGSSNNATQEIAQYLRVIATTLARNPNALGSGSNAANQSQSSYANSKWEIGNDSQQADTFKHRGSFLDEFEAGIKEQLMDSLAGGNFKKNMQAAMDLFAKEFGMDIRDLPREAGKQLTQQAADVFKNSKLGKFVDKKAGQFGNWALDKMFGKGDKNAGAKQSVRDIVNTLRGRGQSGTGGIAGKISKAPNSISAGAGKLGQAGTLLSQVVGGAGGGAAGGGAMAGLANGALSAVSKMGPYGAIIAVVAKVAMQVLKKVFGPMIAGLSEMVKALGKAANREDEQRKKMMENAKKRMEEDVKAIAQKPFEILQKAAEAWADTWDKNLRKIGQTQGYDKESVYALYESYAERLRSENLGSVINATDIVDKLSSVLETGLSGQAAEEFAYIATKLNAAIPTQDFFSYADTYASIAANAISQGESQQQALAKANDELEQFASNLLYSSRELAGGFTTGLKDGSNLFKEATQIAQAAKTYNASDISGTLTSVSAIIGAVAPDLASSLVTNVVQAALGGNNTSQLVALRSLAGVNASNTEFLRAMAEDPQAIFSTLFTNLANMQNMSPDNYMEVAEGLADVFGIDKAAFARVDFNYLAQAIDAMRVNYDSLDQNLALLESGQTTTSAEQLKAQEINRVILEEGLAYVIDSEAGRMIQEHMWQEQIANELANTEYAVSLQGAALEFLEGIRKTVSNLLKFLNPFGFIGKALANIFQTNAEIAGNEDDLAEILKLGAVGSNTQALYNLTTRGKDLKLTNSLVEMMGGTKGAQTIWSNMANNMRGVNNLINGTLTGIPTQDQFNESWDALNGGITQTIAGMVTNAKAASNKLNATGAVNSAITSRYNWAGIGKSVASAIQSTPMNTTTMNSVVKATTSATAQAQAASNKRFEEFLNTAKDASKTMSYDEWVASAKSKGISNFAQALENYGKTEADVKAYFEESQTEQGAAKELERKEDEQKFRDQNRSFWDYESGSGGVFQSAMWLPFFGEGKKYDTRMTNVDMALSNIQRKLGNESKHTVISGLEVINRNVGTATKFTVIGELDAIRMQLDSTFVTSSSKFQLCLKAWLKYFDSATDYSKIVQGKSDWKNLQTAQGNNQKNATLALANALDAFTKTQIADLDPQLQTNVLLGEVVVILEAIRQQNNTQAGGLSLIDTISALGLGTTKK